MVGFINKRHRMSERDVARFISYAVRFQETHTYIDSRNNLLHVKTKILEEQRVPSKIATFKLTKISDRPPGFTPGERKRWLKGEFSSEE